jgi:hypothetical protein
VPGKRHTAPVSAPESDETNTAYRERRQRMRDGAGNDRVGATAPPKICVARSCKSSGRITDLILRDGLRENGQGPGLCSILGRAGTMMPATARAGHRFALPWHCANERHGQRRLRHDRRAKQGKDEPSHTRGGSINSAACRARRKKQSPEDQPLLDSTGQFLLDVAALISSADPPQQFLT